MKNKVAILMGSKSDLPHAEKIGAMLKELGIGFEYHVASAHRTPAKVMGLVEDLEKENAVIIAVVGLSNALSGMLAGISTLPVITCPPNTEDLMFSLRMPPGVAHATVLDPKNAALMAAKIIDFNDPAVKGKVRVFLKSAQDKIEQTDGEVKKH